MKQKILIIGFSFAALGVLLATPIVAGFQLRDLSCDFGASPDWAATLLNWKHLIAYGALAILGFAALRDRPMWQVAILLCVVMGGAEITQAIFDDGHCRLRDMLPNLIAVGVAAIVSSVILRAPSSSRGAA